jgi:hypothetical protein
MSDTAGGLSEEVPDDPVVCSETFLLGVRRGESVEAIAADLGGRDSAALAAALDTDGARLAFWVNIYNAVTQRALDDDPGQYENRRAFFSAPLVTVAGQELSLDDIEHGILRRAYSPFTLGYIRRPSPLRGAFIDRHAVAERDPRIHFALNCGAESCPPIAAYTREEIDDQLDLATSGYLAQTVAFDPDADGVLATVFGPGRATVPRVMLWFRGDFGGKSGILDFLRRYDQLPADASPRLSYRDWDWSLDLGDYTDHD